MNALRRSLLRAVRADPGTASADGGSWFLTLFGPQGRLSALAVFLALATQQGGVLLTGILAFLMLGAQEYGRTASALAFLNIFVALGSVSSSVVVYRLILIYAKDETTQFQIIRFMRLAVVSSAVVMLLAVLGAPHFFPTIDFLKSTGAREVTAGLFFLTASIVISYQQGYLLARGNLLPLLAINLPILALTIPVTWLLIRQFGYTGYFVAMGLPLVIRGVVLYRREPRVGPGIRDAAARQFSWREVVFGFMLPATAAGFSSLPSYWVATEVLFRIPGGAAALGLLAVGISIKQAPMLFATSMISSHGRPVFQAFGEGKSEMVALHRRFFRRSIAPLVIAILVMAVAGALALAIVRPAGYLGDALLVATGLCFVLILEILAAFVYMPVNMGGIMWQSLFFIMLPKDLGLVLTSIVAIGAVGWPGFLIALMVWNALYVICTVLICRRNSALAPFYSFGCAQAHGDIVA